jgi:hypothetical protein
MNTNLRDNLNVSAAGVASAAGDVFYAGLPNFILPLAIGSTYEALTINSAGTIPEWAESYAPLDIVTEDTEVVNTASETTIYTSPDIGGTLLGTTSAVKLFFLLSYLNNSGVNRNLTIKIKTDSTVIFTPISVLAHPTSASRRLGWMDYTLANKGAVDSQRHTLEYFLNSGAGLPTALVALSLGQACDSYINETTSAIDLSSGTHNIIITITHSAAAATISCILRFAGLWLTRAV